MNRVPQEWVDFARTLADAAGKIARRYFRAPITVDIKEDASPVTVADREIERMLREKIEAQFPDHGIHGEEEANVRMDAEYVWVLDPIDGTKSFVAGRPLFTTLIGLTHRGAPILGLIDQPILRDRWVGVKDTTTLFNGKEAKTRPRVSPGEAMLATTSPYLFNESDRAHFEKVRARCRDVYLDCDAYAYGLLASGFLDIVIESDLDPHDFCPLVPVIEGAGGIVTDWQGKKLSIGSDEHVLACGDKARHEEILKLLA